MSTPTSELYFENQHTKKRYRVVRFDKAAGRVTLVGDHAVEFEEAYDKAKFEALGYRLKQA